MMMLSPRLNDLRKQQCCRTRNTDPCIAEVASAPVRNQRVRKQFQIGLLAKRYRLRLRCIIGIHRVNLGRRLRGHVSLRARPQSDLERKTVALQETTSCGDREYMRKPGNAVITVERTLGHVWRAAVEIGEDRLPAAQFKAEVQEACLAHGAAFHLRRFVLK